MYSLRYLWDNTRRSNIQVIRIPGAEKESGAEKKCFFKKSLNSSQILGKTHLTDSRNSMNPNRLNSKKSMPRHIRINLLKTKDKFLKQPEKNNVSHRETMI